MQNGPQELPQIKPKPIELYTNFATRNYPRVRIPSWNDINDILTTIQLLRFKRGSFSDGCFGGEVCQRREVER